MVKRGDVYYADLSPVVGSEQGGIRPVLIIQNDIGNRFSPTVIVAATRKDGFERDSVILLEQIRTIDKQRLTDKITHLDEDLMAKVNKALEVSLGVVEF